MAEPNLLSPSSIKGMTKFVRQKDIEVKLVLENPIDSGKTLKINSLSTYPPKVGASAYFFIVNAEFPYSNDQGARFKYDRNINVGGNAGVNRWTVINKNEMIYLPENTAIWHYDGGGAICDITISYEEIG
jgi:hypothetical protein